MKFSFSSSFCSQWLFTTVHKDDILLVELSKLNEKNQQQTASVFQDFDFTGQRPVFLSLFENIGIWKKAIVSKSNA